MGIIYSDYQFFYDMNQNCTDSFVCNLQGKGYGYEFGMRKRDVRTRDRHDEKKIVLDRIEKR